jgi:hypothetical protein
MNFSEEKADVLALQLMMADLYFKMNIGVIKVGVRVIFKIYT